MKTNSIVVPNGSEGGSRGRRGPMEPSVVVRCLVGWVAVGLGVLAVHGASPTAAKQLYDAGRYEAAQTEYQKLLRDKPDDSRLSYNAATAAYKHGDYTNAALGFENALATQDLKLQQKAYYNLGNTQFQMGEKTQVPEEKMTHWEESLKGYSSALKLQPEDADAKHNQAMVQQMLEELKKQMPKQKQKNPNQKKDDKKDEDKDQDKDSQDSKDKQDKQDSKDQQQKDSKDQDKDGDASKKDSQQDKKDSQQAQDKKDAEEKEKQDQQSKSGEDKQGEDKDKPGSAASKSDAQAQKEAEEEKQAAAMGKMTPQMAEKLLDAQKRNEKSLLFKVQQQRPKGKDRVFKNW